MEQIVNHHEARLLAASKQEESNLARCYLQLEKFYWEIAKLTIGHGHCCGYACVSAADLGEALDVVEPEWTKCVPTLSAGDGHGGS